MPAVLYGQHPLSIDLKHRVLIPAEVRRALLPDRDGIAFFVVVGDNGKLWLYPEKTYDALAQERKPELAPAEEELEFDHLHYALAERREWDDQGRILLPAEQLKETQTGREVMLVGAKNHLEIWNRQQWEEYRAKLQAQRKAISQKGRQTGNSKEIVNKEIQGT